MSDVNLWWPLYVSDFTIDTAHLSNEEVGAYIRLLNAAWRNHGVLRNDPRYLAKLVIVSPQKWRAIFSQLEDKFEAVDGKLIPLILVVPRQKAIAKSLQNRANAARRWSPENDAVGMQTDNECNATAMRPQCDGNAIVMQDKDKVKVKGSICVVEPGSVSIISSSTGERRPL